MPAYDCKGNAMRLPAAFVSTVVLGISLCACASQAPRTEQPIAPTHTAKHLSDGSIELFVSQTSPDLRQASQFSMPFDDALAAAASEECPNGYSWPQQPQDAPKIERDRSGKHMIATLRRIVRCK